MLLLYGVLVLPTMMYRSSDINDHHHYSNRRIQIKILEVASMILPYGIPGPILIPRVNFRRVIIVVHNRSGINPPPPLRRHTSILEMKPYVVPLLPVRNKSMIHASLFRTGIYQNHPSVQIITNNSNSNAPPTQTTWADEEDVNNNNNEVQQHQEAHTLHRR